MSPKKAAKQNDPHKDGKDARRAFEHLGRVQALAGIAPKEHSDLATLIAAAETAFQSSLYHDSATLLRAAEHLSFSAVSKTKPEQISRQLAQEIRKEFKHLVEKAEEHGDALGSPDGIRRIYIHMKETAADAMQSENFQRALELARGAEALTHLSPSGPLLPAAEERRKRLKT